MSDSSTSTFQPKVYNPPFNIRCIYGRAPFKRFTSDEEFWEQIPSISASHLYFDVREKETQSYERLIESLTQCKDIKTLHIRIMDHVPSFIPLLGKLACASVPYKVSLSHNSFLPKDILVEYVHPIIQAFYDGKGFGHADFSNIYLPDGIARQILSALANNKFVSGLDFPRRNLICWMDLTSFFKVNSTIKSLSIDGSCIPFGDTTLLQLGQSLEFVEISSYSFGKDDTRALVESLPPNLKSIRIPCGINLEEEDVAQKFVDFIKKSKTLETLEIGTIHKLPKSLANDFVEALISCKSLMHLYVSNVFSPSIEGPSSPAVRILSENTNLKRVNLARWFYGDMSHDNKLQVIEVLKGLNNLEYIHINGMLNFIHNDLNCYLPRNQKKRVSPPSTPIQIDLTEDKAESSAKKQRSQ